jgi:hypothetical protein
MSQTNFHDLAFSHVLVFVKLSHFSLFSGVNLEVLRCNYNLFVEVIDFFLFLLSKFFHHIVTRDENGVKVFFIWEGWFLWFDFRLEIRFTVGSWYELEPFHVHFSGEGLLMMRNSQILNGSKIWFFRMLIPIFSFHDIIKATLCFPTSFVIFLGFLFNFIFVNNWESKTKMFGRISVEFSLIFTNLLSKLFFLKLPYVQLLVAVLEHIHTIWDVQSFLKRAASAHTC